jgi:hypothetical protein
MFALLCRHHLQHLCEACKPSTGQEAQILAIANFEICAAQTGSSTTFRDNLPVHSSKQSKKKPWTACHLKMEPTDCPEMYVTTYQYTPSNVPHSQSQWPSGLRRGSAAARLLGLRVRIPPRAWTTRGGLVLGFTEYSCWKHILVSFSSWISDPSIPPKAFLDWK